MIPEEDILGYFVWIPRYAYDYINIVDYAGGTQEEPGEININFLSGISTEVSSGYKVHPAFTFGSTSLRGMWVGKFETSSGYDNVKDDVKSKVIYIKPHLTSLRNQSLTNQFQTSLNIKNIYRLDSSFDSHSMKNSEWGAVAYLSSSKYGKLGNADYVGVNKEVYQNKSEYITGCSAGQPYVSEMTCYNYDEEIYGTGASTTGNIYGIYDMSGGTWESVMGISQTLVDSLGLTMNTKYYDLYTSFSIEDACDGGICYGHALSETKNRYSDYNQFITESCGLLNRGGGYNSTTQNGLFNYNYYGIDQCSNGQAGNYWTFRTVLVSQ